MTACPFGARDIGRFRQAMLEMLREDSYITGMRSMVRVPDCPLMV
jgi:hypothetical protein